MHVTFVCCLYLYLYAHWWIVVTVMIVIAMAGLHFQKTRVAHQNVDHFGVYEEFPPNFIMINLLVAPRWPPKTKVTVGQHWSPLLASSFILCINLPRPW